MLARQSPSRGLLAAFRKILTFEGSSPQALPSPVDVERRRAARPSAEDGKRYGFTATALKGPKPTLGSAASLSLPGHVTPSQTNVAC